MAVNTKDFITIVRESVTAIQGASKALIDLSIGSVLRAIIEANASVILFLQGLILQLLATTRAATSNGSDLDSFMNDFGVTRLPAKAASGQVTFSRFTATAQAVVLIGTSVQSLDATQIYLVTIDVTNVNYSASLGGYVLAAGIASINVPVLAVVAASAGNVTAGTINTLTTGISGVDAVTNALGFVNGADAESEAALRIRFVAFVASLSKATKAAVGYAITSLQQGLTYTLTENLTYGGVVQNGYFYVVVDDGTGTPTSTLLSSVSNSIDAVRPVSSTFGVFAPIVVTANISMTLTAGVGYTQPAIVALVAAALRAYVNTLPLGVSLTFTRLAQVAYDASPGVVNVSAVLLNSLTADITATPQQVIKTGLVTIS